MRRRKSVLIRVSENFKKFLEKEKMEYIKNKNLPPDFKISNAFLTEKIIEEILEKRNNNLSKKIEKINKKIEKFLDS